MINQSFLQTFFSRKPDAEQIIRQAIFLDTQARNYIARGNAAHRQGDDGTAYATYTTAISMAETADYLRSIAANPIVVAA